MFRILALSTLILAGCTKTVVPQTANQLEVVTYSELISVTNDVSAACKNRILTKDTCADLAKKLRSVKAAVDNEVVTELTMEAFNYVRGKL